MNDYDYEKHVLENQANRARALLAMAEYSVIMHMENDRRIPDHELLDNLLYTIKVVRDLIEQDIMPDNLNNEALRGPLTAAKIKTHT